MINRASIQQFLNRPLDNWDFIKSWSDQELDASIAELNPRPEFATPLFSHQKACFLLGLHVPELLYILDMGLGKTLTVLAVLSYWKQQGKKISALVLVPNLIHISSWQRECNLRAPNLKCIPLHGDKEQRIATLKNEYGDVWVINYDGLLSLTTDRTKAPKGKKSILVPNDAKIAPFAAMFQQVILDECDEVTNHQTVTFKVIKKLSELTNARFGLSGHPFSRDATKLWGEFNLVDQGKTLGNTLGIFRESFFDVEIGYWGEYKYKLKKGYEDRLHQTLKHRSIRYRDEECQSLPKTTFTEIPLYLGLEARDYYKRAVENAIEAKGNFKQLESVYVNMRQITSGFVTIKDKELNAKEYIPFAENPKLDALQDLLEEMPIDRKCLVYHTYIYTGELIANRLKEMKVKHLRLYGGTKDKDGTLAKFLDDPSYQVLVLNSDTGAKGLNLQCANYLVFFESPDSDSVRSQAIKRIHRTGQTRPCFFYDLLIRNSIDTKIQAYLRQGRNLFRAIIDGEEQLGLD